MLNFFLIVRITRTTPSRKKNIPLPPPHHPPFTTAPSPTPTAAAAAVTD